MSCEHSKCSQNNFWLERVLQTSRNFNIDLHCTVPANDTYIIINLLFRCLFLGIRSTVSRYPRKFDWKSEVNLPVSGYLYNHALRSEKHKIGLSFFCKVQCSLIIREKKNLFLADDTQLCQNQQSLGGRSNRQQQTSRAVGSHKYSSILRLAFRILYVHWNCLVILKPFWIKYQHIRVKYRRTHKVPNASFGKKL